MLGRNMKRQNLAICGFVLLFLTVIPSVTSKPSDFSDGSYIISLRGGIGAVALIDNAVPTFDPGSSPSLDYTISIQGPGVLISGMNSGAIGWQRANVRTMFAFGFGPVSLVCEINRLGQTETQTKSGFMIGFLVLAV
jgi:hypothetical protein